MAFLTSPLKVKVMQDTPTLPGTPGRKGARISVSSLSMLEACVLGFKGCPPSAEHIARLGARDCAAIACGPYRAILPDNRAGVRPGAP